MEILNTILRYEGTSRIAIFLLAIAALVWLGVMLFALLARRNTKTRFNRYEIAVALCSLLLAGSIAFVGKAFAVPEPVPVETSVSKGGSGTCASVRPGMTPDKVRELLGDASLEKSAEDTRGPGATAMVFEDSRCIVHFLNGAVDQVE